ncbi:hypothetical protein HMF8227_01486 [Saliniradius amylolyticus]|uniref:DUF2987 domain-containing protein n=1 Tax=Saliniradius amylolyticus TaxID=2183582 RepID=A0A2S2E2U3_9ALTE|nr:DUF2987 domain-containing protein [Saliniradius amylolyticus]AWL11961.1 hypothetical protein HMF8227_01486 [Saliniradius amylolyticus]
MRSILLIPVLAALCCPVNANTLELDYKSLYSHVRKLDDDTMPALQFAFGLLDNRSTGGQLCQIQSATLVTQKKKFELPVTEEGRFTVWAERALKMAKAKVKLQLTESAEHCDMSVQLEAKPEYNKTQYDLAELRALSEQYQVFFDEMGSFLSFLMPGTQGIQLQFDVAPMPGEVTLNGKPVDLPVHDRQIRLSSSWLTEQGGELSLPKAPKRITAWVEQSD